MTKVPSLIQSGCMAEVSPLRVPRWTQMRMIAPKEATRRSLSRSCSDILASIFALLKELPKPWAVHGRSLLPVRIVVACPGDARHDFAKRAI